MLLYKSDVKKLEPSTRNCELQQNTWDLSLDLAIQSNNGNKSNKTIIMINTKTPQ